MKNIEILGNMGEKLVRNLLSQNGHIIEDSIDVYDSRKDFIRNGKKCEVKTEQPYVYKNCFSFRKNQLLKCRNVDELYVVSVPPQIKPTYEHGGKIFLIDPTKFRAFEYVTKAGIEMVGIPIEQESVQEIYTMSQEERNLFTKYTQSNYGV
jgi:hypothetical protein